MFNICKGAGTGSVGGLRHETTCVTMLMLLLLLPLPLLLPLLLLLLRLLLLLLLLPLLLLLLLLLLLPLLLLPLRLRYGGRLQVSVNLAEATSRARRISKGRLIRHIQRLHSFGKGQMGAALMGSLQINCFLTEGLIIIGYSR